MTLCDHDDSEYKPDERGAGFLHNEENCPAIVHDTVKVKADITIRPKVEVGEVTSTCVGCPRVENCRCHGFPPLGNSCTFTLTQDICVEIPLTFSATATAEPSSILCGMPAVGECCP